MAMEPYLSPLVMSFHPKHYDIFWLEKRFGDLCLKMAAIYMESYEKKLKDVPIEPATINKIFGRHSAIGRLLILGEEEAVNEYLRLLGGNQNRKVSSVSQILAMTQVLEVKSMVSSAKNTDLYHEMLKLFECYHLTFLDDSFYQGDKDKLPLLECVKTLTRNVLYNENSLTFKLENQGLETLNLLRKIEVLLLGNEDTCALIVKEDSKIFSPFEAYVDKLRARTFMGGWEDDDK